MTLSTLSDAVQFVRGHPSIFFPGGEPSALVCVQQLAAQALVLGGDEVAILRDAAWWAVGSRLDWFVQGQTAAEQFARLIALPEAGANTSRVEVVIAAYADDVSTLHEGQLELLSGRQPPVELVARLVARRLARAVIFRFPGDR